MSNEADRAKLDEKVKKASQLLFLRRHRAPGVREWELKKVVGDDYPAVLKALDEKLDSLGLTVKQVIDGGKPRFLIVTKGKPPGDLEPAMGGFKIDAVAALAMALVFLISHGGRAPPSEVESFLSGKFNPQRARTLLARFQDEGYLQTGKGGAYELGWRSKAEIDLGELANNIVSSGSKTSFSKPSSQPP